MSSLLTDHDALGLAELVRTRQVHPRELVQAAIERIEALNPTLNAVIHKRYEKALAEAETVPLDAPLMGVPVLAKDVHQEIQGEPMTFGSKAYASHIASEDSYFVRQLKRAGAIFLGITNVPEFALMAITEPTHYGPTRNPWDLRVTPGGSSGGSAAAVAAGMVPMAGASDGGGSIRIPAAYCGLFGLKPTRGRTPVGPKLGRHWLGASVNHVLTRSVRDSAAALDCLVMEEKAAAFMAPRSAERYLDVIHRPLPKRLRVAFTTESPLGTKVDPECAEAVARAARFLETLGHEVEERTAPVDGRQLAQSYIWMYFGEVGAQLQSLRSILGREPRPGDVEPATWLLGAMGQFVSAADFVARLRAWDEAAAQMEAFHETYDVYLTPTTAMPPARIGELSLRWSEEQLARWSHRWGIARLLERAGIVDKLVETSLMRTPFTQLANLTGQPAMSLPLYRSSTGVPLGVQVVAARGREDLLLQLAALLEQTSLWLDVKQNPLVREERRPPTQDV
ncbi:amidase [Alicyclobacillus mali]|uniref:Amidase n=1 Tax=Alicyclobacillus mali (ex Roth et al. 2021) TaxID=1123961 RepID=A0ABS0EZQ3_9BACL|nr:amidase family protein [Alicyclobacillus mali (ex Roth et al. 2021)]MBF8376505.1 amidase [Alicyclobacillus mali (ex Roth et al. 2021)]